eukprot:GFUD01020562.1.p1 GENE.GFUD01020562.1~~GFUD01020562.1.p1  ORF type:complete len:279 (+),score=78.77 GFUD01020562.1:92-928(+)
MLWPSCVQFLLLVMAQSLISEPSPGSMVMSVSVQEATAMDHSISTIKDYRQYLRSIQKIYLKQSFLLPMSNYVMQEGIGLRNAFSDEPQLLLPEMAMPAACTPELTTVPIQLENLTAGSFIFPTCTRIEQCGGCCSHPLLSCQPTQTELVIKDVLVIDVEKHTDRRLPAQLTRHLSCACGCSVQERHCGPLQLYYPDECKCECSNWTEKVLCSGKHQLWDETVCGCRCTNLGTECSTGLQFSRETCRCEKMESEGGAGGAGGTGGPPLHGRPNSRDRI